VSAHGLKEDDVLFRSTLGNTDEVLILQSGWKEDVIYL